MRRAQRSAHSTGTKQRLMGRVKWMPFCTQYSSHKFYSSGPVEGFDITYV